MRKLAIVAAVLLSTAFVSMAAETETEILYRGNPDSKTLHKSGCRYFTNTNCTAIFSTREAATGAGYAPCKVCKP